MRQPTLPTRFFSRLKSRFPALLFATVFLTGAFAATAPPTDAPLGVLRRLSQRPVLSPQGTGWESAGTFNPAVTALPDKTGEKSAQDMLSGKIVMLYRAQDSAGTSRIGYAESQDGIHFTRRPAPVLSPQADYEKDGGVEDPRLQKFGDTFYLMYTGYNKKDAQLCLATSPDLIHWQRKGVILPAYKGNWNVGWTKSGAIVPQKIGGKYWMYWLGTAADKTDQMGLSYSDDLIHWTEATETPVLPRRPGNFDSRVVEPGPPPIITDRGILLIYNGADDHLVYRTGVAIFDRADPRKVIYRSEQPLFAPEKEWEKIGQVPNVVFVEGLLPREETFFEHGANGLKPRRQSLLFYYGAADKYIGVAEAALN